MTQFVLELLVVLAALAIGARVGGVGLGVWGGVGLAVLTFRFGAQPTSPPIDVMLIIIAVITAASVMEAAGGIDWLVSVAERVIRANPRNITLVAPLVTWGFTFAAGTGHIVYPLLPVIYEVAHENGIRPERPIAIATIASQQAITASPVSAATAVMIGLAGAPGAGSAPHPGDLRAVHAARRAHRRPGPDAGRQGAQGRSRVPAPREGGRGRATPQGHRGRRRGPPEGREDERDHLPRRGRGGRPGGRLPGPPADLRGGREDHHPGHAGRHRDDHAGRGRHHGGLRPGSR